MELSLMEKKMIEDKVSELLNEIGYRPDRDTYVDVVGFVRKHGFVVGNALLDDDKTVFWPFGSPQREITSQVPPNIRK